MISKGAAKCLRNWEGPCYHVQNKSTAIKSKHPRVSVRFRFISKYLIKKHAFPMTCYLPILDFENLSLAFKNLIQFLKAANLIFQRLVLISKTHYSLFQRLASISKTHHLLLQGLVLIF